MEPNRQNLIIVAAIQLISIGSLWFASQVTGWQLAAIAFIFAFVGLSNYAIIHEACHGNLHTSRSANAALGSLASLLFPVSFTFMAIAHRVHHNSNRTDNEMFDYYYPEDNKLIKFAQWYSILIGIYPPIIPLGSVIMALCPWVFWLKPWQEAKSSSIIFNRSLFGAAVLKKIRIEVFSGLVYWTVLFYFLQLNWVSVAVLYAAFWFNWSTRQYVTHAFSKRDVMNGAHNLSVSPLMEKIFLNGQWDLVHHQHPEARWQDLPQLGRDSRVPIPYWSQYFKQWLGPRPNKEAAPVALNDVY
ncbi:MAG: fatty acid desaturase [Gammaproteobacteria bacterium]|nr:fatty acid desaturase [Gammaproteobacteria bacterium]